MKKPGEIALPKAALGPCPFCGSGELMVLPYRITMTITHYGMSCKKCGGGSGPAETVMAAVNAWNARCRNGDDGDLANALGLAAVVYGMMHKIPDAKLRDEATNRGWIVTTANQLEGAG